MNSKKDFNNEFINELYPKDSKEFWNYYSTVWNNRLTTLIERSESYYESHHDREMQAINNYEILLKYGLKLGPSYTSRYDEDDNEFKTYHPISFGHRSDMTEEEKTKATSLHSFLVKKEEMLDNYEKNWLAADEIYCQIKSYVQTIKFAGQIESEGFEPLVKLLETTTKVIDEFSDRIEALQDAEGSLRKKLNLED